MSELDRRQFLSRSWKWGLGFIGVAGVWTSWDLLRPGTPTGFGGVVRTVTADEVPEGGVVVVPAARAYLTKHEGEVIAIAEKCPHLGCRVAWCESSGEFECPCHGSAFNRLGEHRTGPSPRGMDRFPVVLEDGVVNVDTGALEDGAPPGSESIDEPKRGPSCAGGH